MFFNFIKTIKFINKYNKNSIILLSEGNTYYTTNKPIIDELIKEIDVLYITFEKNDNFFSYNHKRLHVIQLDYDFWGRLLLAMIKGNLLITTTPSINVLSLKKSPNIKHYSYFMHSSTDIHYYQKHSFDYFDSVICSGNFQVKSLNQLENKRKIHTKEKQVLGIPYYDIYKKEIINQVSNKKYILVAPSWGSNNFLNYINYDIFEIVFNLGYNIIYRPHPMSLIEELDNVNSIINKHSMGYNNLEFIVDKNYSPINSINMSCALISAHSGMVMDYILLTNKPVLFYNIKRDTSNLEHDDISFISWDEKIITNNTLQINNHNDLQNCLKNILSYKRTNNINDIVNLGCSSKKIAEFFVNKFNIIKGN